MYNFSLDAKPTSTDGATSACNVKKLRLSPNQLRLSVNELLAFALLQYPQHKEVFHGSNVNCVFTVT